MMIISSFLNRKKEENFGSTDTWPWVLEESFSIRSGIFIAVLLSLKGRSSILKFRNIRILEIIRTQHHAHSRIRLLQRKDDYLQFFESFTNKEKLKCKKKKLFLIHSEAIPFDKSRTYEVRSITNRILLLCKREEYAKTSMAIWEFYFFILFSRMI